LHWRREKLAQRLQSRAHGHNAASKAALKSMLRRVESAAISTLSDGIPKMRSLRPFAALLLALSLAACAAAQSQPDLTPPPKKPLDAKTQLEAGRNY
jgi:hypothetical protein